ncbi:MAG: hypothetical protein HY390_04340 [Deltaproteobacteria bacterium]|nr:hypothetical protein [Deltaproteobacteria bacterium]
MCAETFPSLTYKDYSQLDQVNTEMAFLEYRQMLTRDSRHFFTSFVPEGPDRYENAGFQLIQKLNALRKKDASIRKTLDETTPPELEAMMEETKNHHRLTPGRRYKAFSYLPYKKGFVFLDRMAQRAIEAGDCHEPIALSQVMKTYSPHYEELSINEKGKFLVRLANCYQQVGFKEELESTLKELEEISPKLTLELSASYLLKKMEEFKKALSSLSQEKPSCDLDFYYEHELEEVISNVKLHLTRLCYEPKKWCYEIIDKWFMTPPLMVGSSIYIVTKSRRKGELTLLVLNKNTDKEGGELRNEIVFGGVDSNKRYWNAQYELNIRNGNLELSTETSKFIFGLDGTILSSVPFHSNSLNLAALQSDEMEHVWFKAIVDSDPGPLTRALEAGAFSDEELRLFLDRFFVDLLYEDGPEFKPLFAVLAKNHADLLIPRMKQRFEGGFYTSSLLRLMQKNPSLQTPELLDTLLSVYHEELGYDELLAASDFLTEIAIHHPEQSQVVFDTLSKKEVDADFPYQNLSKIARSDPEKYIRQLISKIESPRTSKKMKAGMIQALSAGNQHPGLVLPVLKKILTTPEIDDSLTSHALEALSSFSVPSDFLPVIKMHLKRFDPHQVQEKAIKALASMQPMTNEGKQALLSVPHETWSTYNQLLAWEAVASFGPDQTVFDELEYNFDPIPFDSTKVNPRKILPTTDVDKHIAAKALFLSVPLSKHSDFSVSLVRALTATSGPTAYNTKRVIEAYLQGARVKMGIEAPQNLETLMRNATERDQPWARDSAYVLFELGEKAKMQQPSIQLYVDQPFDRTQGYALEDFYLAGALLKMNPNAQSAIAFLKNAYKEKGPYWEWIMLDILPKLPSLPRAFFPEIKDAIVNGNTKVGAQAQQLLRRLQKPPRPRRVS